MDRRHLRRAGGGATACVIALSVTAVAAPVPKPAPGQAALAVSVAVQHGAITLVGANGAGVQVVAVGSGGQQLVNPAWAPDGHKIAYTSLFPALGAHRASSVVFIARFPNGKPRALTAQHPGRLDDDATYSSLGTRVAFSRASTAPGSGSQIMVAPASFGPPIALTSGRSSGHTVRDTKPAWSPSGTQIAFTRTIGTRSSIWVMRTNGSGQHRVIANGRQPAWSPDSKQLAYVSIRDHRGRCGSQACAELYVAQANGSGATRLTKTNLNEADPAWSPDGSLIAFARGGGPTHVPSAIYTVDPTGACPFRVTGSPIISNPAWRPGLAPPKSCAAAR